MTMSFMNQLFILYILLCYIIIDSMCICSSICISKCIIYLNIYLFVVIYIYYSYINLIKRHDMTADRSIILIHNIVKVFFISLLIIDVSPFTN